MGKGIRDTAASDSSVEERRKSVREEQKVRKKKKKSKKNLIDLQRRLLKSRKNKETKIDGKSGKARNSNKHSNRILPRPLAGIYRNGAIGKRIQRSENKVSLNDTNDARLQGNVYKLLNGCDSESERVIDESDTKKVSKNPLLDSNIKNILQPTPPGDESLSPVLGKVDGKKRCPRNEPTEISNPLKIIDFPRKPLETKKTINIENLQDAAIEKYEELCAIVSAENFEGKNFLNFGTDPLTATKKKLRNMYAESFRSQYLRDMIKRGTIFNETLASSSKTNPTEAEYCSSGYVEDSGLVSVAVEKPECQARRRKEKRECGLPESENIFVLPEKHFDSNVRKNDIPTPHLLFDLSLINPTNSGVENLEPETNDPNDAFLQSNYPENPRCKKDNNLKYFEAVAPTHVKEMERLKTESPLFMPSEAQVPDNFTAKKHLLKRKVQHVQTMNLLKRGTKKHPGRGNLKISQQVKTTNLKHVPAILRRCNNHADNNRINLFDPSMHINKKPQDVPQAAPKQNVLFSPQLHNKKLEAKEAAGTIFSPTDVRTCVVASPSLRKDKMCFKSCRAQPADPKPPRLSANEVFVSKKNINPPVQRTIMFTKKDSRNIGHCLHLNTLIADRAADNPNLCVMRRSVSVDHEPSLKNACSAHKSYHRCSQGSDGSYYCSQESNASQMQNAETHQKPVVCEKVLLRRVPQHPRPNQKYHNDQHVCYVMVDPNDVAECSNDNGHCQQEKPRPAHNRRFHQEDVPDIGILKGVQNLKILPVEEPGFTNDQCAPRSTMVLEQQPIKYLAVENDTRTQKIPIYVHGNRRVASVDNVDIIDPGANYRVVSCPRETAQQVIYLPACDQKQMVYGKQENLARPFEEPRARKMILCRPEFQSGLWCVEEPSNLCEVHVPEQNLREARNASEIRKPDCDEIVNNLKQGDKVKASRHGAVSWDDLRYRSNHEYQRVNDTCSRNHAIFYQE